MDKRTADKLARTMMVLRETLAKAAPDMAARCGDDQDPEHLARLVVVALQRDPGETERALRARVAQLERQAAAVRETCAELTSQLGACRQVAAAMSKG